MDYQPYGECTDFHFGSFHDQCRECGQMGACFDCDLCGKPVCTACLSEDYLEISLGLV